MADLSEIATEDLMKEVERRLNCQSKPEKRLILVGKWWEKNQPAHESGGHRVQIARAVIAE